MKTSVFLKYFLCACGSENASIVVSTMFDTGKKCTVWHYGLSRSPGNKFAK